MDANNPAQPAPSNSSAPVRKTRRTEGIRTRGRAARVVEGVLSAAAEELGAVGYAGLRIEEVAQRSGVNKTTIYRRWPSKATLVAAAVDRVSQARGLPDTGTLRGDALEMLLGFLKVAATPVGLGITRMMQTECAHPDVEPIVKSLRERNRAARLTLAKRAIARGELPADTDPELVVDLLFAPVISRIVAYDQFVSESYAAAAVDAALAGLGVRALAKTHEPD